MSHRVEGRVLVMQMVDQYSTAELRDAILRALDDPATPVAPMLMFDMRASVAVGGRSAQEIEAVGHFLRGLTGRCGRRMAMVVGSDLVFGLMRMGSVFAEGTGIESRVFRDVDAAHAWLLGA